MKRVLIGLFVGMLSVTGLSMTHNLNWPWGDPPRCSPPQSPLFAFYNHAKMDFLFETEPEVELWCQVGIRASALTWSLHHNQVKKPIREGKAVAYPGNLFSIKIPTAGLRPGFYDVRVKAECGYEKVTVFADGHKIAPVGVSTFGWRVKEMKVVDSKPADFDAFWAEGLAEYRKVPLDLKVESEKRVFTREEIEAYNMESACLPGNFDPDGVKYDEVVSYKVSWAGPDGRRVYAWVARPNVDGVKFPAMYVLPGGGTTSRPRPLDQARHGYVAMDVQVHGFDVEVEGAPQVPGYNNVPPIQFEEPRKFCWYPIYLRVVRGVEALCAMPEVDASKIVTVGGSQGGRLSYVVSALEPRVSATVPCISHGANMPHLAWVEDMNKAGKDGEGEEVALKGTQQEKCEAYFDPMNFASKVTCPVYANAGLVDPVSHAYSTWAVWTKAASANKTWVPVPGHAHDWFPAFDQQAYAWLEKVLQLAK